MKKLIITTAVILMTSLASTQAHAELTLVSNNQNFTYEPNEAAGNDNFTVGGVNTAGLGGENGLSDFAIYLGYLNADGTREETQRLTSVASTTGGSNLATGVVNNRGSITFDQVTFGNGVTVDPVATFRLTDSTGVAPNPGDPSATLLYDLALSLGNTANNSGRLESLVGFDFNQIGGNDRNQGAEIVSGFSQGEVAVGEANLVRGEAILSGAFSFEDTADNGRPITPNNLFIDQFNGPIANNLDRFDNIGIGPSFISGNGDTGFAAFSIFSQGTTDRTLNTAGAIGFRVDGVTAAIPEPSTLLMASMGLGMVAFRRRRKQLA